MLISRFLGGKTFGFPFLASGKKSIKNQSREKKVGKGEKMHSQTATYLKNIYTTENQ